ncbi:MAG: endonuclease VII domain-containing protein [Clostridia bacterium]
MGYKNKDSERAALWNKEHPEKAKEHKKKWLDNNPEAMVEARKKWKVNNRERLVEDRRRYKINTKYKITSEEYNELLEFQDGVCAICGKPETSKMKNGEIKPLGVDHDHETQIIRGLLCSKCNCGLGHFNDNIELLQAAIIYLDKRIYNDENLYYVWSNKCS